MLGKIISFGIISSFWKPYYLFSQTFHRSVWDYWRGMAPYYLIFAAFTMLTIWLKRVVIDPHSDSIISLAFYGLAVIVPLLTIFFILLFQFTPGMKYFVARKPKLYSVFKKYIKLE